MYHRVLEALRRSGCSPFWQQCEAPSCRSTFLGHYKNAAWIKGSDAQRFEVGVCAVLLDNFANEIGLQDGLKIISLVKQDDAKCLICACKLADDAVAPGGIV